MILGRWARGNFVLKLGIFLAAARPVILQTKARTPWVVYLWPGRSRLDLENKDNRFLLSMKPYQLPRLKLSNGKAIRNSRVPASWKANLFQTSKAILCSALLSYWCLLMMVLWWFFEPLFPGFEAINNHGFAAWHIMALAHWRCCSLELSSKLPSHGIERSHGWVSGRHMLLACQLDANLHKICTKIGMVLRGTHATHAARVNTEVDQDVIAKWVNRSVGHWTCHAICSSRQEVDRYNH